MPPETAEQTKDRIRAGFATFTCAYVAGMVLVVFLIVAEAMEILEWICPACFGH